MYYTLNLKLNCSVLNIQIGVIRKLNDISLMKFFGAVEINVLLLYLGIDKV